MSIVEHILTDLNQSIQSVVEFYQLTYSDYQLYQKMGQQLFKVTNEIFHEVQTKDAPLYSLITSDNVTDDIGFFFSNRSDEKTRNSIETNNDYLASSSQIRTNLFQLTNSIEMEEINAEINRILKDDTLKFIEKYYERTLQEVAGTLKAGHQLQETLANKFKEEEKEDDDDEDNDDDEKNSLSQLSEDLNSDESDDDHERNRSKTKELSYFAIKSLMSVVLILIKSVEKNDSTVIREILSLADQLCQEVSIKYSSYLNQDKALFQSLKPLINYIKQLSLSSDLVLAKQAIKILLRLSIVKAAFKDILSLLSQLILDTKNTYDIKSLFKQLNKHLTLTIGQQKKRKQQRDMDSDSNPDSDSDSDSDDDYRADSDSKPDQKQDNETKSKESAGKKIIVLLV